MYLLENIQFTKEKINNLYHLSMKYKWWGPEAPILLRLFFSIIRNTYFDQKREHYVSYLMNHFKNDFLNLQRASMIPPEYWDSKTLEVFESYVLNERASTVSDCIDLYNSEFGEQEKFNLVNLF